MTHRSPNLIGMLDRIVTNIIQLIGTLLERGEKYSGTNRKHIRQFELVQPIGIQFYLYEAAANESLSFNYGQNWTYRNRVMSKKSKDTAKL